MSNRKWIVAAAMALLLNVPARDCFAQQPVKGAEDRQYWSELLFRIAWPIAKSISNGTLHQDLPLETAPGYYLNLKAVTYGEAVGRTLAGIAPWLALPDDASKESALRQQLREALLKGLPNLVNPQHPDHLNFETEMQPLVDAAFLAQAFLRAPAALWEPLDSLTKKRYVAAFQSLRNRNAYYSNWLLFAGITEAFLLNTGENFDPARIDIAIRKMKEWYVGDGLYSDGEKFAMDYYNSFVIQPMLVDILKVLSEKKILTTTADYDLARKRMVRYAVLQEKMISPEGTYPITGRSITYRTGAFQALAQTALEHQLPEITTPAQVRCALTAVMKKLFEAPGTFSSAGWLQIGLAGHQPELGDPYISTGSLYLATVGFLPLGLPASDPFWTTPAAAWSSQKAFSGQAIEKDHKIDY
ncbi:DUF2264 domain-containing protein [Flavihumibacter petaseus]|uniref:DUF2264 domain-containing protein n=1 Tax=Flavihumibacter petaseus NBRC 106054 TaxID=1220578 RepID=A0A0E9N2J9_9BACT|nr:DUF2264 domain-containing protein [Flavihumibacter petaseus]GAO43555.1 hypothetical protein FPE01S_02_06600 [Flavihumibacter petaseus NBRC 106054]